jgi:hypothetical protein
LCASKSTVANAVFVDFESYDGKTEAEKWAFSPSTGAFAGFFGIPDGSVTPVLSMLAGHTGSYGLNVAATQATAWGAALGTWMSTPSCLNASSFAGITFWVRGATPTGTFSFGLSLEETTLPDSVDPAGGGTCAGSKDTCKDPSANDLPLTADWTQVTLPWASFTGGLSNGTAVTVTGDRITGFSFNLPLKWVPDPSFVDDPANPDDMPSYVPEQGDIDFTFDDFGFN